MTSYATSVQSTARSTDSDAITLGPIHLDITTPERALAFWRDVVGFQTISEAESGIKLGVGEDVMLVLHPGASKPLDRHRSGLYHLALHLPNVHEFARMAVRVQQAGLRQYPVDHLTHLADYVDDYDGNGLEIVFETRDRFGSVEFRGNDMVMLDSAGNPHSGRDPIDMQRLIDAIPGETDGKVPVGAFLGHIHLRVADVDRALAFYRDQIGLTTNVHVPGFAMFDMSAGGTFPHRLAGNAWESKGQAVKDDDASGMRSYTLVYRDPSELDAAIGRIEQSGGTVELHGGNRTVLDPSGITLHLVVGRA